MKKWYSDEFEALWRAYDAPANASKKTAYEAFQKAKNIPKHDLLLKCIEAYNDWLRANSKHNPYPKAHMATWINQERWEGFLDRGEELLRTEESRLQSKTAAVNASASTWPVSVLNRLTLSPAIVEKWILPTTLKTGDRRIEIICPTNFHADWVQQKFRSQIERALGPDVIISGP